MTEQADVATWMIGTWGELLGFKPEGPDANLFDLGGDSLVMLELLTRIDERFEIEFPVAAAFKDPKLGSMVAEIRRLATVD
jgi:acyl carrier protein